MISEDEDDDDYEDVDDDEDGFEDEDVSPSLSRLDSLASRGVVLMLIHQ